MAISSPAHASQHCSRDSGAAPGNRSHADRSWRVQVFLQDERRACRSIAHTPSAGPYQDQWQLRVRLLALRDVCRSSSAGSSACPLPGVLSLKDTSSCTARLYHSICWNTTGLSATPNVYAHRHTGSDPLTSTTRERQCITTCNFLFHNTLTELPHRRDRAKLL